LVKSKHSVLPTTCCTTVVTVGICRSRHIK
jgi:hypothetical protein